MSQLRQHASRPTPRVLTPLLQGDVQIALSGITKLYTFDAYVGVTFPGALPDTAPYLIMDSGNTCLIVPSFTDIQTLPNFTRDYEVLLTATCEPFGCKANLLRGPVVIPTLTGPPLIIPDCVFYACTAPNKDNQFTANFGLGRIDTWPDVAGTNVQAPLTYLADFPFAEIDIRPAPAGTDPNGPLVFNGGTLNLLRAAPAGYQMLATVAASDWMSVLPHALSINAKPTGWPGTPPLPIAMIDTGGGPAFLSDPAGLLYKKKWPPIAGSPGWTHPNSEPCTSTAAAITIILKDASNTYTSTIDTALLPPPVQGLTLLMCEKCEFMYGQNGLNVGGVFFLFNMLLIDYRNPRIGLKPK